MSPEATAAIIAAIVSTTGGLAGILVHVIMTMRERSRKEHREELDRFRQAEEIRSIYRDPLLNSAWALQSRIYNIVEELAKLSN